MTIFSQGPNPANRAMPWAEALSPLARSAGAAVGRHRQEQQQIAENTDLAGALKRLGPNASFYDLVQELANSKNISPLGKQQFVENFLENKKIESQNENAQLRSEQRKQEHSTKVAEKLVPLKNALNIIGRQEQLLETGNLGPKIGIGGTGRQWGSTLTKQGREDRAEYEQNAKALISSASNIPIKNQVEFERLTNELDNPNLTREEIKGRLKSLRNIVEGNLAENEVLLGGEGGQTLGAPEGWRSQREKPQFTKPMTVHHTKSGKKVSVAPEHLHEYYGHPDFEILESDEFDRMNQ